ncbi:MAG: cyclic pyranopterin monophosphate synthase MoaC [Nitrospirae bacterium]|nr:cyclic pyranopterin monophosphate synthase MoaC [Nitrospirota bacterium]MBI3359139.1 cyclic pyranopterin monophosphate synthase MoaC [Candidatus Troglogloeales bacterium]MBI3597970.1 cyclic pyranopterin monophosphate synthase MoaC [Candidatus Troglogloeales bacterium]
MSRIKLSHFNKQGQARMVDISQKLRTRRIAIAVGTVFMSQSTLRLIEGNQLEKGNLWEVARLAGIMAAKKTPELIPMCHPILLGNIDVDFSVLTPANKERAEVQIKASVTAAGQTGVEMEAMTAVSIAALTLYDMCKAVDKGISVGEISLTFKSGGKSGTYKRGVLP